MNATNKKAVAKLTANFRKCDYGYIACTHVDSVIAESFLPDNVLRTGAAICFKEAMLSSFTALATAAGVKVEIVSETSLKEQVYALEDKDTRDW